MTTPDYMLSTLDHVQLVRLSLTYRQFPHKMDYKWLMIYSVWICFITTVYWKGRPIYVVLIRQHTSTCTLYLYHYFTVWKKTVLTSLNKVIIVFKKLILIVKLINFNWYNKLLYVKVLFLILNLFFKSWIYHISIHPLVD